MLRLWWLVVIMSGLPGGCGTNSNSAFHGRPNTGGLLKLEKVYELVVENDPRLMKGRSMTFLSYPFRDSSFGGFLVDELIAQPGSLACELLDMNLDGRNSLITQVIEESSGLFRVTAADLRCEMP